MSNVEFVYMFHTGDYEDQVPWEKLPDDVQNLWIDRWNKLLDKWL